MKVLITGAQGFVGRCLALRLASQPTALGQAISQLILADRALRPLAVDAPVIACEGDLGDAAFTASLAAHRPDVVFHLASVPGGAAERDQPLGRRVNLDATLNLFEQLGDASRPPVVVFASTIAVYGSTLPAQVGPDTPLNPPLTYGAHKLMGEIALADATRRGLLDGRSVRLPGIVARPREASGLASAFMSELLHALAAGEPFTCPVSADATAWWMSAACCVDNLVHAATLATRDVPPARVWQLPVLRASMREVVEALGAQYGDDRRALVRYAPDESLEAVFGRYPPLDDAASRAAGFTDDGDIAGLVRRALTAS